MLLVSIAGALEPDDPDPLREALVAAAGVSLAPGAERYWWRRMVQAWLTGHRPFPSELARAMALHRAASAAMGRAMALMVPENFEDAAALEEAAELMDRARALREEAGPPFVLILGRHRFSFGMGW